MKKLLLPIILLSLFTQSRVFSQSPIVQSIIDNTNIDSLVYFDRELSGDVQTIINGQTYTIVSRNKNQPSNDKAADYIQQKLEFYGLEVFNQSFSSTGRNVYAVQTGTEFLNQKYIICAHYDDMPSGAIAPGADDNASGVAGLLELASLLSDIQIDRTVKFIAFANEEPPFFKTENMGSRVYAKSAKEKNENIKAVFILESIGYYSNKLFSQNYPPLMGLVYPSRGNFVTVVGNLPSRSLAKEVVVSFKKNTSFPIESFIGPGFIPGVDFSDNWSFWHEGYPCVMITDTAFYRNSNYHAATDTYEKLDYDAIAEVVSGLGEVVIEITKAP